MNGEFYFSTGDFEVPLAYVKCPFDGTLEELRAALLADFKEAWPERQAELDAANWATSSVGYGPDKGTICISSK